MSFIVEKENGSRRLKMANVEAYKKVKESFILAK